VFVDDLTMLAKLARLIVDLLVLGCRRDRSKDAEILVLRQQLAGLCCVDFDGAVRESAVVDAFRSFGRVR